MNSKQHFSAKACKAVNIVRIHTYNLAIGIIIYRNIIKEHNNSIKRFSEWVSSHGTGIGEMFKNHPIKVKIHFLRSLHIGLCFTESFWSILVTPISFTKYWRIVSFVSSTDFLVICTDLILMSLCIL